MNIPRSIAAIYVEKGGVYWDRVGVDAWDIYRDARNYTGPYPVVAHPPCNRWIALGRLNYSRWGGEHNRPGNDGGCFEHALWCVSTLGGVLEHPANTYAFEEFGIRKPKGIGWNRLSESSWVCEVWQSAYGHAARKRTWLYYHSPTLTPPNQLIWQRPPGTHQIGRFDQIKPVLATKQAHLTPSKFADELILLARMSTRR
jgi:hypothetical protein